MYVMNLLKMLLGSTVVDVEAQTPQTPADAAPDDTERQGADAVVEPAEDPSTEWPQWADDRLGYWPVHDRGGAMSEYVGPGDRGMLGVLARIELNEEDGREPDAGLPDHALAPRD